MQTIACHFGWCEMQIGITQINGKEITLIDVLRILCYGNYYKYMINIIDIIANKKQKAYVDALEPWWAAKRKKKESERER